MSAPEQKAFAVILGGGAGTRLWPSSRRARPKQLLSLGAPESLIAAAVRRGARRRRSRAHAGRHRRRSGGRRARRGPGAAGRQRRRRAGAAQHGGRGRAWARSTAARRAGPDAVHRRAARRSVHRRRGDVRAAGAAGDRRGRATTIVTIGVRPTHAGDRLRLHPPGRAAAARPARTPCTTWAASSRSPTARPPSVTSRRATTCGTRACSSSPRGRMLDEARRHLPALGALLDAAAAAADPDAA